MALPEMVTIPAGGSALSDRRTGRSWLVHVASFEIAVSPVTQAEYAATTIDWPSTARGDGLPVEHVSWWDAVRFCNALSECAGLSPAYHVLGDDVA